MVDAAPLDVHALRSAVSGPVLVPGEPSFAEELEGFNRAHTHTPAVVVGATDAADVAAAVRFARDAGLPVRVLATGHGSHAAIGDGVVITTGRLDSVSVDADARTATVGGGASWASVVAAAAPHGLAPIAGSAPTVGVVGYLLGGGLGPFARSHGFSSDFVRSATVVTGTGDIVQASADADAELLWALRGGKGGLGVVVSITIDLVPMPELYGGNILFPTEAIAPVLRAWAALTTDAPPELSTSVAIVRFPPIEQLPPFLRGQTLLALRVAYPAAASEGERLIAPLRAVAPALADTVRPLRLDEVASIHNDPTDPGASTTTGAMLDLLDADAVEALLDVAGPGEELRLVAVELRHLGAATHEDVPAGSAVGGRGAGFTLALIGSLMQPGVEGEVAAATDAVLAALAPWISAETTINFAGAPVDAAWPADVRTHLDAVRRRVDPDGVFPYWPAGA
ncbi:FAD-binding protein [Galbitalea sp. SE-J8]|uniref:FAD-binding oxidoreductase n=1 Tax=Galbitalea sp. SE-J8 TaxID=3054952 RepID=UPI00259D0F9C|nr:FAD-binding protein [Galbitalea sp. SE-J8]MDM4763336.1 FAD-binding protein [Galbitalea sp. SE-J8]